MIFVASILLSLAGTVFAENDSSDITFTLRNLAGGAKEYVCHFPPGNPANFKTLSIGGSAVAKHLKHGDWLGSCEDNCIDICTSTNSPIFGTGLAIEDCFKKCGLAGTGVALLIKENSPDLAVVSCDALTVEIQGSLVGDVSAGKFLIYLEGDIPSCSSPCSPLFRKIESVMDVGATTVLTTRFATAAEIIGESTVTGADGFNESPLEPLAGCPHSDAGSRKLLAKNAWEENQHRQLQGSCPAGWRTKNADGRCRYTNCFVGEDGSADDCFECKTTCANGCGPDGGPNFDGNLILFDFGRACCNHDHCWSSTFSRATCDSTFYDQMVEECPPLIVTVLTFIVGLPTGVSVVLGSCDVLAAAFYLLVSKGTGDKAYAIARQKQETHEKKPVCVAQCPTTQRSGGQGTTRLTVDLLKASGTFQVSYEMYTIPDRLFIDYEGTRIFDTGGLVSGSQTVDVAFSGTSTLVQVTIDAPNANTAWDVSVGCP